MANQPAGEGPGRLEGVHAMLKKKYEADGASCNVSFVIKADVAEGFQTASVVGDFNNWDVTAHPMKRSKKGDFEARLLLAAGKEYQFRYYIDGERWVNDWNADKYNETPYGDAENCVVIV